MDEIKIKEGLVYNKHSGSIIRFTDLGDINNELMHLRQDGEHPPYANHFFRLQFSYADFGTQGITADTLYPIVWEAVHRLEVRSLVSQLMVIVGTKNFLRCVRPWIF